MSILNGKTVRRSQGCDPTEPDPYLRMRSKLSHLLNKENNPNPPASSNPLSQLLAELEDFHSYYINKYSNLKADYDALTQKLLTSEQRMGLEIDRLCLAIQHLEAERDRLRERSGSAGGESLHRFYESIQQSIKDANRAEGLQYQDEIRGLKDKIAMLTSDKAGLQLKCEAAATETSALKLKLREYEIEQKYEAERINNSTFSLKVELASKQETVDRLRRELEGFRGLREGSTRSSLPGKEAVTELNSYYTEEGLDAMPFLEERKSTTRQNQTEPRPQETTQKKQDKSTELYRRHLSPKLSTPQNCSVRDSTQNFHSNSGPNDLKIKILRLDRMRKK